MRLRYDLHIHSGLSPCADDDMTPVSIVGTAKVMELDLCAVSDHNAIGNVEVALAAGKAYDILVVPAFELQTQEDIHLLCICPDFERLSLFYKTIEFQNVINKPEIFGNQNYYDEEDNVIGKENRLLLTSASIPSYKVPELISHFGGVAVPAHIDREANGMLQILGAVTEEFTSVEFSPSAPRELVDAYKKRFRVITDSDSHTLSTIDGGGVIDLKEKSVAALIDYLLGK